MRLRAGSLIMLLLPGKVSAAGRAPMVLLLLLLLLLALLEPPGGGLADWGCDLNG
jgi:hypothetical protein